MQSGPAVQLPLGVVCCGCVCAGETGAPPPEVCVPVGAGVVSVAGVVAVEVCVTVAWLVDVVVAEAVVVEVFLDVVLRCLCAVDDVELLPEPPHAAIASASTTTDTASMAARASPRCDEIRCMN